MSYVKNLLFVAVLLLVSVDLAQSQILYGAATGQESGNEPSSLYMINPATGDADLIGPIGFNGVTGLEYLPDGRLIASANADEGATVAVLIEINKDTGAGSLIGVLGNSSNFDECGRMPDVAYDSNSGVLFGYSDSCNGNTEGLYVINQNNAQVAFVGPSGFTDGGNGLAVDPSGTIFGTPIDADGLITLNRSTGAGTVIPESVGNVPNAINAMDFNPENGVLYGSFKDFDDIIGNGDRQSYLVTINTSDGTITVIGQTVLGLDAIVFFDDRPVLLTVPTLSEWGLISMAGILGIVGFMVMRRRKIAA
jgi:exosortase sorting signal-containing protein